MSPALLRLHVHRLVNALVEDANGLPVDVDGVGNEYLALEHAPDAFGDRALAVAGFAVKQNRAPGVDGRAHQAASRVGHYEVAQCFSHPGRVDREAADRLLPCHLDVLAERHGSRADVLVAFECLGRALIAAVAEAVLVLLLAEAAGADDLDELFTLQKAKYRFDHSGERQSQAVRDVARIYASDLVDRLDAEVAELPEADAGLFDAVWLCAEWRCVGTPMLGFGCSGAVRAGGSFHQDSDS